MVSFVSLFECISTHLFHPVCIGARLACSCLAYVPAKPNMFSVIDAKSIMSLLSRLRIQDPIFVFTAMKNSTISRQDFLVAWVRHCLVLPPSGMASHSSSSDSQSLLAKYIEHCLKPGKAPGPDKCPNELLKTMSDEEFLIVQVRVNEIWTIPEKTIDTARQSQSIMSGTISQLHKGGSTNKTSDQTSKTCSAAQ